MNYMDKYNEWLNSPFIDEKTKEELLAIKGNEKEIEERFYRDLEFGTAGLRGIVGAGSNRMNRYTVSRATQGLANYIKSAGTENPSVAIAYDCRHFSREFAHQTAAVLNANGIKVYIFDDLRPTPELSFAVRKLSATAGIVITASHNPPDYNGYKVYWSDGAQIVSDMAVGILEEINAIKDFGMIKGLDGVGIEDKGLFYVIGGEMDNSFIEAEKSLMLNPDIAREFGSKLKVVYTPLHGAGNKFVRRVLNEAGFKNVIVVTEQEMPDPDFATVKSPNPEEPEAFDLAVKLAKENDADFIIGTDPDSDRVGVVVKKPSGEYQHLSGNQTGILLVYYIISSLHRQNRLNKKSTLISTVVTGDLGRIIAESFGVNNVLTLTGFKFMAEKVREFEKSGTHEVIMSYEESFGYMIGTHIRDKDAVSACLMICEMAAWYKKRGMSLYEGLMEIYEKYGCYREGASSIILPGKDGMYKMKEILDRLRKNPPQNVEGKNVIEFRDYMTYKDEHNLPKDNILYFRLEDKSWFAMRPSGTEPKLKIYYSCVGKSLAEAEDKVNKLKAAVENMIR